MKQEQTRKHLNRFFESECLTLSAKQLEEVSK